MTIDHLIQNYGYMAIFFGVMAEGEAVLIAGMFAVKQHFLDYKLLVLAASSGAMIIDQFSFFLGRKQGQKWLNKHPKLQAKAAPIEHLISKNQILLMLGVRFMIGFRTITLVLLGMSRVSWLVFLICDAISALVWATAFSWISSKILHLIRETFGRLHPIEQWILGLSIGGGLLIALCYKLWSQRKAAKEEALSEPDPMPDSSPIDYVAPENSHPVPPKFTGHATGVQVETIKHEQNPPQP